MRRLLAALVVACFTLPACASTGVQTVAGMPHGPDRKPANAQKVVASEVAGTANCYDDGQSGPRVQAVYLVAADQPDRYSSMVGSIRTWIDNLDTALNDSAAEQGGSAHFRWACTNGQVDVLHVNVGASEDDTIQAVRTALQARGYSSSSRKYITWADTTDGSYCGISFTYYGQPNAAPTYAQVNRGCWGLTNSVELHELGHEFGAVRLDAPHTTGQGHCTDESDRLCEQGASTFGNCPSAHEKLWDCNHDDYADWRAGSTLVGNAATSIFMVSTFGAGSPSPTPTTPSPTPTASPTPSPTVTVTPTPSPTKKCPPKSNRPGCR